MKYLRYTGHIVFIILFFLAAYFYKERILYIDSSFYTFKMIFFNTFNTELGRHSAVITQILPLMAIYLALPLKTVIITFSFSFILIYYIVYLICVYVLKNDTAGIIILLTLCVGVMRIFYFPVTEIVQGLVYTALFFAWIFYPHKAYKNIWGHIKFYLVSLIILALCFFSHFSTVFPILFILAYYLADKKRLFDRKVYLLLFIIITAYFLKVILTNENSYDGNKFAQMKNIFELLPDIFNLPSTDFYSLKFTELYVYPLAMFIIILTVLIARKELYKSLMVFFSGILLFLIICIIFHQGDSLIGMEKDYITLNLIIYIPFIYEMFHNKKSFMFIKTTAIIVVLFIGIYQIYNCGLFYNNRIDYIDELLEHTEQYPENKFLIEYHNLDGIAEVTWAFACETLLYSSLDGPQKSKTIYVPKDIKSFNNKLESHHNPESEKLFLCVPFWLFWTSNNFNPDYFILQKGKYRLIEHRIPHLINMKPSRIAIKCSNGKYLSVCTESDSLLFANENNIGDKEIFTLCRLDNNNKVALLSYSNYYVCADETIHETLIANRIIKYAWEEFTIADLGNNNIALQSHKGLYVTINKNDSSLVADSKTITDQAIFKLINVQ